MMERKALGAMRGIVAAAGVALIVSVFLPWADANGESATAWDLEPGIAVLCVLAGVAALVGAATDGQIGLFRPDVSSSAAADLLNVAATATVAAFVLFDAASPAAGAYLALASAAVAACGSADWRVLRGAPLFPR
jgi:Na+/melibiose symporter-like transporter